MSIDNDNRPAQALTGLLPIPGSRTACEAFESPSTRPNSDMLRIRSSFSASSLVLQTKRLYSCSLAIESPPWAVQRKDRDDEIWLTTELIGYPLNPLERRFTNIFAILKCRSRRRDNIPRSGNILQPHRRCFSSCQDNVFPR